MSDVQSIPLARLLPDPDNVNIHNEVNIAQIKASIERFGFLDPMGVVKHPERRGYFTIVEGHGRYDAATLLELVEVPCLVLTLDEAHRKGYAIAHNQTQALTPLDQAAVSAEFQRLDVQPEDFLSLGYSDDDVMFMPGVTSAPHTPLIPLPEGTPSEQETTTGEQASAGEETSGGFVPAVHRTTLNFASEVSYNRFVYVLTKLRDRYPNAGTIGERLIAFMSDHGLVTAGARE